MHPAEPDDPEDYAYDLAHEVPSGPDRRNPRTAYRPRGGQARPADIDTDYSSDEAHDL